MPTDSKVKQFKSVREPSRKACGRLYSPIPPQTHGTRQAMPETGSYHSQVPLKTSLKIIDDLDKFEKDLTEYNMSDDIDDIDVSVTDVDDEMIFKLP